MKKMYLDPVDNRKSFYGKCYVVIDDNGTETLYSYDTPIMNRDPAGKLTRIWGGWSVTTGRHIKAFAGLNKAAFLALPTT